MAQMKEQFKTSEKELNKREIGNLSNAEFKTLIIRMLKKLSEVNFDSMKKTQLETKDSLIEIKNNLQGNNNRLNKAKNQINDTEHKGAKTQSEQQEEKRIQKMRIE